MRTFDDDEDRTLREDLAGLPLVACPPEVTRRIEAAVAAEAAGARAPRRRAAWPTPRARWWWAAPVAAVAVLATVLLRFAPAPEPAAYTPAELARARADALAGLSVAVEVIEKTQREAIDEVLGRRVPGTLRASVQKALQLSEGGPG